MAKKLIIDTIKLFTIVETIRNRPYISFRELQKTVEEQMSYMNDPDSIGLSESTIRRDFKEIRENLHFDIKYSRKEKGFYVLENEIADSDYERMFDSINPLLIGRKKPGFVFTEQRKSRGEEHLLFLIGAIEDSKVVQFSYVKYDNTLFKEERFVQPYALKEFKNRWYLLAVEMDGRIEERGRIKTWGLDRMKNLYLSNKSFSKNVTIDIEREFNGAFGIFSDKDKEIEEVILSFTSTSGKYNDSLPLHESQETLIDNNNEFRVRLKVKLTYDFIMELLSQSENMKVVSPIHLRDTLVSIHEKAIKMLESVD